MKQEDKEEKREIVVEIKGERETSNTTAWIILQYE